MYQYFSSKKPLQRENLLLSKDYWMNDDSTTHCYSCSKPFTTFKRRHHCRLCGKIFCNDPECTKLIPGDKFDYNGTLRICKFCQYNYDDSSDDYEDDEEENGEELNDTVSIHNIANYSANDNYEEEDNYGDSDGNVFSDDNSDSIHESPKEKLPKRSISFNLDSSTHKSQTLGIRSHDIDFATLKRKPSKRARSNFPRPTSGADDVMSIRSNSNLLSTKPSYASFNNNNLELSKNSENFFNEDLDSENIYKELNQLGKYHLSKFLRQTLIKFQVKKKKHWSESIINVLSQIPPIDLDQSKDVRLDITESIKIKEILGGNPKSSVFTNGLVFTKNVASTSMRTKIKNPRIMIIKFPLEYSQSTNKFMSFEQVLPQEKEYLNKLVKRIVTLNPKPDILVVGSSVNGYALELLGDNEITVLSNVKHDIAAQLARLTQTEVITSMEKLALTSRLGFCEKFEIKTYPFQNWKKTFAFFTGCSSNLGGTIIIRDTDVENLAKIKGITEFIVYCMFHLKLETHYFRNSSIGKNKNTLLIDIKKIHREHMNVPQGYYWKFVEEFHQSLYSISPSVILPLPYLLRQARFYEQELEKMQINHPIDNLTIKDCEQIVRDNIKRFEFRFNEDNVQKIAKLLINKKFENLTSSFKKYSRQWDAFYSHQPNLLEVSTHQNICFSFSTTIARNKNYCSFPKVLQVEYYLDFNDLTLGQFVQHEIESADTSCREGCGFKMSEHYKTYTHGEGSLKISLEEFSCPIQGLSHVILMWSVCKKCGHKTPVIPMDDTTKKFSFGKFLELSFLSVPLHVIFEDCPHDAQREHVRYFGLDNKVIKVEYNTIKLFELILPQNEIDWLPESAVNLKIDLYEQIIDRITTLFQNIIERLESVKSDDSKIQYKSDDAKKQIDILVNSAIENESSLIDKTNKLYNETLPTDYISMNVILKIIQEFCLKWNDTFTNFEKNFLPEFSKASSLQFLKFFGDKDHEIKSEKSNVDDSLQNSDKKEVSVESEDDKGEKLKQEDSQNEEGKVESLDNNEEVLQNGSKPEEPEKSKKPKYASKVSMVPKLKLNNSKVKEKIHQMEALIANDNSIELGQRSPSIKSPLSNELKSPLAKDFESYNPKVSELKSYFDQMQMKFNKQLEEQRKFERKLYESKIRGIPTINSQQTVEVYKNVNDAVKDETDSFNDDRRKSFTSSNESNENRRFSDSSLNSQKSNVPVFDSPDTNLSTNVSPKQKTDPTNSTNKSPPIRESFEVDSHVPLDERNSLFIMFKKLLADRTALFRPIESPLSPSEHIFVESDVIIRDDEPGSIIAFALSSKDYLQKVQLMRNETLEVDSNNIENSLLDDLLEKQMLKTTAIHLKYQFLDNNSILSCKIFFMEQFEALREKCGLNINFIQSLSRCAKWDSNGGKSGSSFLKTLDDRFIIKQMSSSELDSFVKMAPTYFAYMTQALFHDLPTALAKIFGFYQIVIKNPITGKNFKMDVLIMENLFYGKKNLKIFDLKGSLRNRLVEQTGKENEVLLDENMVELLFESPLFMRNHSKKHLRTCLWNDTLFLSKMNVMDYSLVIGIDWNTNEITAGLIDYVRTFTWDKKLESWVKEKGLVGGLKRKPTVVTPKQYKSRFRTAMEKYVILVPDSWHIDPNASN